MREKSTNIFDRLIIIFIVLLVFGGYGGALQPIRVFTILSLPFTIHFYLQNKTFTKYYKYEFKVYFVWFFYGIITLLWVINPIESLKELAYLAVNFTMFFTLIFYAQNAKKPKDSIISAWKWVFILTIPIALAEFLFDTHLSLSTFGDETYMNFGDGLVIQRRFASVTFGNLNSYNVILIYVLPFLLSLFILNKHQGKINFKKIFNWALFLILIAFILLNSSRAAIFCMLIILIVFMFYYVKNLNQLVVYSVAFVGVLGYLIYSNYDLLEFTFTRFKIQGLSDTGRLLVFKVGFEEFFKSGLLGIGAADFMPTMERHGIVNTSSHSLLLEVLIQYGIVVFILFLGLFVRIIRNLKNMNEKSYRFAVISMLIVTPLVTIINSGYLPDAPTWVLLASLYIISDVNYIS